MSLSDTEIIDQKCKFHLRVSCNRVMFAALNLVLCKASIYV